MAMYVCMYVCMYVRVLYETRNVIARPLFLILRRSLEFGTLPTDWKLAVQKKGSKSDSGNYRPISLTSVCCKNIGISGSRSHYEIPVGQ